MQQSEGTESLPRTPRRRTVSEDWHRVENALIAAASGAGEPLYSQLQDALVSLYRLGATALATERFVRDLVGQSQRNFGLSQRQARRR